MGLRYHLATMVAVIVAFGLGVAFSVFFAGQTVAAGIVAKQTKDIEDLRTQFREQIVTLQDLKTRYSGVVSALLRDVRLNAVKVAIIQTGDYPDTASKVRETLDQAGATVAGIMVISPSIVMKLDGGKAEVIHKLRERNPGLSGDSSAVWQTIAAIFAKGNRADDIKLLREANLVQSIDGDLTSPVDYVVIVGGASDALESRADAVDVPLIKALQTSSEKVIFAESENAEISYIANLQGNEIATIDNADTDIGRLALALAFHGQHGDYGVKKTARGGPVPSTRPQQ